MYLIKWKTLCLVWIFCYLNLISSQKNSEEYFLKDTIPPPYVTPKSPLLKYMLKGEDLKSARNIVNLTEDIIADSAQRINSLYIIKQDNMRYASFEIGYLICIIQTKYKKMVDKYLTLDTGNYSALLYRPEIGILLEETESMHWEIDHLTKMLHEVERKYKLYGSLDEDYSVTLQRKVDFKLGKTGTGGSPPNIFMPGFSHKDMDVKEKDFYWKLIHRGVTKPRKRPLAWPIDYGWHVEPEFLIEGDHEPNTNLPFRWTKKPSST